MPRIKTLLIPDGTEGRGYPRDVRLDLTGDQRTDIATAVEIEHSCDDSSCDISAAMSADCPYSAAYLLLGATETPVLDRVLSFYGLDLTYFQDAPDWNDWLSYHQANGKECSSCGAYTYGDEWDTPEVCGNCLKPFPPNPDFEEDGFIKPSGYLGSKTSASLGGTFLGEYDSDRRALAAIRLQMSKDHFWPNVWSVSDHGNVDLVERYWGQ